MTIKGAQKQMIVVRTGNSRFFDEAYFVLRREVGNDRKIRKDILQEANRILEENRLMPHAPKHRRGIRMASWVLFLAGGLCGGGVSALMMWLLL